MSELELHVTKLETAQRIKTAGAEFETLFVWASDPRDNSIAILPRGIAANPDNPFVIDCPAYLASELSFILGEVGSWTTYQKNKKLLFVGFTARNGVRIGNDQTKTEADGRGQIFAVLLEQKLIETKHLLELA